MIKKLLLLVGIVFLTGIALAQEYVGSQVIFKTSEPMQIVRGRTGLTNFDAYLDQYQVRSIKQISSMPGNRYFIADLSSPPDYNAIQNGQVTFPGIDYIQPNYLNSFHMTSNDPMLSLQQLDLCDIPQAWNYSTGSNLVLVGVVDSGIIKEHPDLAANVFANPDEIPGNGIDDDGNGYVDDVNGWDFADAPEMSDIALGDFMVPDNDVDDENYHGTHVSGIIGAVGNNRIGISGVCWNVKILPIRAGFRTTQGSGFLQDDDAAAAIIYATDMGCSVVNLSWGDPNYSPIIGDACQYAYEHGVVLVASAGNDPGPYLSYPAKLASVIAVGAVDQYKNLAGFSSWGPQLDLVAPGQLIISTYRIDTDTMYEQMSGTSMSAPFVTGSVALLLSLQPGLTPPEIRAKLLNSTDDLGPVGVDAQFGHGLLNTRKLIENLNPPYIFVGYPLDQIGITDDIDIIGSAYGDDVFRYTVMYSTMENPSNLDWYDVSTHLNAPQFYWEQVHNGLLAHFSIPDALEDDRYLIRVQIETLSGGKYNYFRAVYLDRTPPVLRPETLGYSLRYDKQGVKHYIIAVFDEPVRSFVTIFSSGNEYSAQSAKVDSTQVWAIPPEVPPGEISIKITAVNNSELEYVSPLYEDFADIQYELIPTSGFSFESIGEPRVPLGNTLDFDGNGIKEYVSMLLPSSGYGDVVIKEPTAAGHLTKYDYQDKFWPLDIGDTNNNNLKELLYLRLDKAVLKEVLPSAGVYPTDSLWTDSGISGGVLADYSGDNISDILLVKNLTDRRIIQTYRHQGGVVTAKNQLLNNTSTSLRNTFVPTIIVKNFDGDNIPDILTADTDGDIMVYEVPNQNTQTMTWTNRFPVSNTYYLTSGDYNGDGRQDFFAGGYYRDVIDPSQNFWYFEGFRSPSNDIYTSMGYLFFNDVLSQNAIYSADVDNDNKDEIILAISPNLYIIKYIAGEFKPVWYANSFRTYQITGWEDTNQDFHFITNYQIEADSLVCVQWSPELPFTGPVTPANLNVLPVDNRSASLRWNDSGADHYRVYRKDEEENIIYFDLIQTTDFSDTTLVEGNTYYYAISAFDSDFTPQESNITLWQSVIPMPRPEITSIVMVSVNEIRIIFDQQLATTSTYASNFFVDNDMGNPFSVNSIYNQYGLQLRFRHPFTDIGGEYVIIMNNVRGLTGVEPLVTQFAFSYNPDMTSPQIISSNLNTGRTSHTLVFSESLESVSASEIDNYVLQCPANDADNRITSIVHDDDKVTFTFEHQLKYSNQPYYMLVSNVTDLAGNVISPLHNKSRIIFNDINTLEHLVVFPNPVKTAEYDYVSFMNFPSNKTGKIKIYNSSGEIVLTSAIGPFSQANNMVTWQWYLINQGSKKVSSGIYYFVVEMDGETKKGKIAVLN